MAERTVAVYLSEHGFGHAMRSALLLRHLQASLPQLHLVLATKLPGWLLAGLGPSKRAESRALAPPLLQRDSLTVDHVGSCAALERELHAWDETVRLHAAWLRDVGAELVYCDVPAMPLEAARAADIPAVALGNFTWDWIYERYVDEDPVYGEAAHRHREAYAMASLYLRLPTAPREPTGMPTEDIPWIGRHPTHSRARVRRVLGLSENRPMVLLSFGGHPGIPIEELAESSWARRIHLVGGRQLAEMGGSVLAVDEDGLAAGGVEYADLVAAADVVVSKPGYGMLADCLFARSRLVYLARPEFPEATLLLEPTMQRLLGAVPVAPDRRNAAAIAGAVNEALRRPRPSHRERLDGVEVATRRLLRLLE